MTKNRKAVHNSKSFVGCVAPTMKLVLNSLSRLLSGEPTTNPSTIRNNYKVLRELKDVKYISLWTYRHLSDYQYFKLKSVAHNHLQKYKKNDYQ